jgi:hypothetical protein
MRRPKPPLNRVKEYDGKPAAEFLKANENRTTPKGSQDPPRGWLRHFVQTGVVSLQKGATTASEPAAAQAA